MNYKLNKKISIVALVILLLLICIFIYFSKAFTFVNEKDYQSDFLINKKFANDDVALEFLDIENGKAYTLINYDDYQSVHSYSFSYTLDKSKLTLNFTNNTLSTLLVCDDSTLFNIAGKYYLFKIL